MAENYYETLGVARNASEVDIKKAYRRLAMKYHPDRNQGDKKAEEQFKSVQKAYQILSDQQKRSYYDQFGYAPEQAGAAGAGGFSGFGGGGLGDIFEDIFGDVFGGGRQAGDRARGQRGADLRYNLELGLEEAAHGKQVDIQFPAVAQCKECKGSGAKKGSSPVTCKTCGGNGQVRIQQGFFSIQQTCPDCRGQGQVIANPCSQCRGQGRIKKQRTLSVKVPAGVDSNDQIRLANEGEAGVLGGPNGDLYVQIQIRKHPIFEREGNDLHCQIPIDIVSAALGGEFEVPTLNGPVTLKIPAETQSGKVFRLRGKGIKSVRGRGVGDLLCQTNVEIPIKLRAEQKELLQEFQKTLEKDKNSHNPRADNWYSRVKRFFEDMKF